MEVISAGFPLAKAYEAFQMADSFIFAIDARSGITIPHDNLIQRHPSRTKGVFLEEASLEARLEIEESTSRNARKKSLTF
jgi:predicted GTPase